LRNVVGIKSSVAAASSLPAKVFRIPPRGTMGQMKHANKWLVGSLVALAPAIAYVAGYYLLARPHVSAPAGRIYRVYESDWQSTAFTPAAQIESALSGRDVRAVTAPLPHRAPMTRPSSAAPILAVLAVVLVTLAAYVRNSFKP
jgi:hypothetical protein